MKKGPLFVLIVLAMVLIVVLLVIFNAVKKPQIEIKNEEFTSNLSIVPGSVKVINISPAQKGIILSVKRDIGDGEMAAIGFVVSNGTSSFTERINTSLDELDERIFSLDLRNISENSLISVSVYPIVKTDEGEYDYSNLGEIYHFENVKKIEVNSNERISTGGGSSGGGSSSSSSGNDNPGQIIVENQVLNNTSINNTQINNTQVNNTLTNSTQLNNTIVNSTVINNTQTNNTILNNTLTNSTQLNNTRLNNSLNNNTIINNTRVNNTIINTTINNTTLNITKINNSQINNTILNNTITNNTIVNTTIINSTITNSTINSTIVNNTINNSQINVTTINNTLVNNTQTNHTIINNTQINNTQINNQTISNNTLVNSTRINNTVINNTVINTTLTNSSVNNTLINSTILNNTQVNNTQTNHTTVNNTQINNTVVNNTKINSTILNNTQVNNATNNSQVNNTVLNTTQINITCYNNTPCGIDGYVGSNVCTINNVTRNYLTYVCNNPGTAQSYCTNSTQSQLIQQCVYQCLNGLCINPPLIAVPTCDLTSVNWNNSNIHNDTFISLNLKGNNCTNITFAYNIYENNSKTLITSTNSSNFIFMWKALNYLNQNNSFYYANVSIANNKSESVASGLLNVIRTQSIVLPPVINCTINLQCGTDGFVGNNFCSSMNVSKNYVTYICNNPGTAQSFCSNSTSIRTVQQCSYQCLSGLCVPQPSVANNSLINITYQGDITNKLQYLGSPQLTRYASNAWARNVWDLQEYRGKIYVGAGSYAQNTGPIDLYYIAQNGSFVKEYVVPDEQVLNFKIINNDLYFAGTDPRTGSNGFYRYENNTWTPHAMPSLIHTFDIAGLNGALYTAHGVSDSSFFRRSLDNGLTWTPATINYGTNLSVPAGYVNRLYSLMIVNNTIYASGGVGMNDSVNDNIVNFYMFKYNSNNNTLTGLSETQINSFYPGYSATEGYSSNIALPYRDIVVKNITYYLVIDRTTGWDSVGTSIFKTSAFGNSVRIPLSNNAVPYDIIEINNEVYVLGAFNSTDNNYTNVVYYLNGTNTKEILRFNAATLARSFEYYNNSFYFGLGTRLNGVANDSGKIFKYNYLNIPTPVVVNASAEHCLEVIPGHNDLNDQYRQNVVVVGFNQNLSMFLLSKDYIYSVNGSQTPGDNYRGIFNFEPYKSNKDAFNLWYVDVVGTFNTSSVTVNVANTREEAVKQLIDPYCKRKFLSSRAIVISDIPSNTLSGSSRSTPLSFDAGLFLGHNVGSAPLGNVAAHEFTHSFGGLPDLYSGSDSYYYPEAFIGQYWKYSNATSYTVVPTTFEDCSKWSPSSDMIGTGSPDGTSFLNTTCVSVSVVNPVTHLSEKVWRPYQDSLMSGGNIYRSTTDPRGINPEFIGPSLIRTICYKMKTAMNGREEGYCANICPQGKHLTLTMRPTPFTIGSPNSYYNVQQYSCT